MKSFTEIKGLSDIRRLPRVGKIHLGIRTKNQKGAEYPKETDYFVVPPEVEAVVGVKPKKIRIMIPSEDRAVYFPNAYKCYGSAASLVCIGDGETAMRDEKKVEKTDTVVEGGCKERGRVEVACASPDKDCASPCAFGVEHGCRRTGLFRFLIPDVTMGGVYQIDTGSFYSIVDLNSSIDFVQAQMQALTGRPQIAGVPLILKRVPTETKYNGKKAVHYCLQLEFAYTYDELRKLSARLMQAPTQKVMIDAPTIEQEVEEDLIPASRQIEGGSTVPGAEDAVDAGNGEPPATPQPEPTVDKEIEEKIAQAIEILGWTPAQVKFRRAPFSNAEQFAEFLSREVDKIADGGGKGPREASPEKRAGKQPTKADIEIMRKGISQMLMNLCGGDKESALGEFVRITRSHGLDVEATKDLKAPEVIAIWQAVKDLHDRGMAGSAAQGGKSRGEQGEIPLRD